MVLLNCRSLARIVTIAVLLLLTVPKNNNNYGIAGACSNILVTPGASEDGSAIIAYNADSTRLFGSLYHHPATQNNTVGEEMLKIYEWETGKYLGEIPQVEETYNVVGNGNEYGLVIGETTFDGVRILAEQPGAIIDYGSMIYLTLQRAKTAREAIETMSNLMDTYGYASKGESMSIADASGEVWVMELIGRGPTYPKKGAAWVARRVPDGMVTSHANQARITTFPRDDKENCMFSEDVVDVAVHYGLYPEQSDYSGFSFSDVYDPLTFSGARRCEGRVWSAFSQIADSDGSFQLEYEEYAAGRNLKKRMPLFVAPYKKMSVSDVMDAMNSHYEGTELDAGTDVSGGLYSDVHRPPPWKWEYGGKTYFNEYMIANHETGWNFVAQIRQNMPRELAALIWFAVDDSSTAPRVPVYASSTMVSSPYAGKGTLDGIPNPMMRFDLKKAFWVQNMVSHLAYSRWDDAYPVVREKIDDIHERLRRRVDETDQTALDVYGGTSAAAAVRIVTNFSVATGEEVHEEWLGFYGDLFARLRDFCTFVPDETDPACGCKRLVAGMTDAAKRRIVRETGSHYEIPGGVEIGDKKTY
mmetsp:Transcript_746/g.1665  ORF Transcript_746/g.1665 Transcript_746/m.1665 type:complete len:585 (-) Transcript_746:94-1848(-)